MHNRTTSTTMITLHRRTLLRAALATAGGAAMSALLAACGGETATTAPAAATRAGGTAPAAAPTTGATGATTGTTAAPVATTAPMMSASAPTAIATTGTSATTAPAMGAMGMTAASNGKTIPELKVGVAGNPDSMDPHESVSNVGQRAHYTVFDTLIRRDFFDNNKLVPSLATDWKRTDDRTLEMNLRKDVTWQDGSPFTADDVVYTFNRLIGPNKNAKLEVASPGYFPLDSCEKTGDYGVKFVSTAVDPVLEKRFAGLGGQIIPAKYHQTVGTDGFRTKPLGTGPYRVVEFVTSDHITYEAYDKSWGGAPAAKRWTLKVIPEVAARIAAMVNGEIDIVANVPPDQYNTLKVKSNLSVKVVQLANMHVLKYNMKAKPLDNKFIRQALNLAMDRKTLVDTIWNGNATYTRGFQFEGEELYDATRPFTPFDLDKARSLLKMGNYNNEVIYYEVSSPNYYNNEREAGEAVVAMWQKAGINAKLDVIEGATKDMLFNSGMRQAGTWSATSGTADPDGYLWRNWGPDNTQQKGGYWAAESAAKYNDLGKQARSTLDRNKRVDLYRQVLDEYENEAPGTTLYAPKEIYATKTTINWTPYSLYWMDLRPYNFKIK